MSDPRSRILLCHDEALDLVSLERTLRARFDVTATADAEAALERVKGPRPFAVVVSGLRMPGMDGVALLTKVRGLVADTVRVLLTAAPDLPAAIAAINEGGHLPLLRAPLVRGAPPQDDGRGGGTAPHGDSRARAPREDPARQHRGPDRRPFGEPRGARPRHARSPARRRAPTFSRHGHAAQHLFASWRRRRGRPGPAETLGDRGGRPPGAARVHRPARRDGEEALRQATAHRGRTGARRADPPPVGAAHRRHSRLDAVREILRYQSKRYDGNGLPKDGVRGDAMPWGARVLRVISDFDNLETTGVAPGQAVETLRRRQGWYDPTVLELFASYPRAAARSVEVREMALTQIQAGMRFAHDVVAKNGTRFAARGLEVTPSILELIRNSWAQVGLARPARVIVRS